MYRSRDSPNALLAASASKVPTEEDLVDGAIMLRTHACVGGVPHCRSELLQSKGMAILSLNKTTRTLSVRSPAMHSPGEIVPANVKFSRESPGGRLSRVQWPVIPTTLGPSLS